MKSSIKVIKRKHIEDLIQLKLQEDRKPVEPGIREIANTIKGWMAELQEKKRTQAYSSPRLPVNIAAATRKIQD